MANAGAPYITRNPGDLITAEDWNDLQTKIQKDIADQVQKAIAAITKVPGATDAETLGGQSSQQIEDELLKKVFAQLPKRTGYKMIFKRLKMRDYTVIKHDLATFPLVDIYQLGYFPVICSEDDDRYPALTTFYLYHDSEKRVRNTPKTGNPVSVQIEDDANPYRILFKDLLIQYDVEYSDDSTLGDIESAFWDKFNQDPNDSFDDDQSCHSPWFDRCCGEKRTKKAIGGDWNRLYVSMRPRKVVSYTTEPAELPAQTPNDPAPLIEVVQYDFNTIGLRLLTPPIFAPISLGSETPVEVPAALQQEVPVIVLLKV